MQRNFFKFSIYAMSICFVVIFMTNCKKDVLTNTTENVAVTPTNLLGHGRCSSDEKIERLMSANPEYRLQRQAIEQATERFVADYDKTPRARAVITIPVVFHIVWKTAAQNISDAQVMTQLKVLNDDFRKLNADKSKVPTPFKPLAADVEINFVLAKQDPSGKATTGIVRKQTTEDDFSDDDGVMAASSGGSNIWNRNNYLNIYVCNLTGYLGYAVLPGGPADIDAAVINFEAFGTIGTASVPYNLGRTVTHEVGHWLNLKHIWGDDQKSNNICGGTDNVADTPNQGIDNSGVPTFPNISCGNAPNGDMFMNYMDYSDDISLYMFSNGQKARMQALFAPGGSRVSLLSSVGANPPSVTPTTPTCTDIYEANNTSATAKTIAVNTNISANIGTATDVDWFTFSNTSAQSNIKITLNNLFADYDVFLYKNNVLVGSSENANALSEQIVLNNAAVGIYKIKVIGYSGAFSPSNCYALKAQTGATQFFMVANNNTTKTIKEMSKSSAE